MSESEFITEVDLLEILERSVSPSPAPLIRARLRLSCAPAQIRDCLRQTLEGDEDLMKSIQNRMRETSEEVVYHQLLGSITRAWTVRHHQFQASEGADINPAVVPRALFDFRRQLNRFGVPISEPMEHTIMEAHRNAMQVMRQDIRLLEQIARSYDNNPNFRHEVGRVTAIREMARGGDIFAGLDVYGNRME